MVGMAPGGPQSRPRTWGLGAQGLQGAQADRHPQCAPPCTCTCACREPPERQGAGLECTVAACGYRCGQDWALVRRAAYF